ncbi:MAG: GNAT family N-acetyltransferase [Chloroflexi bacterium]|nr:GNAT family N-acetyltransferase [Chloroflexota bacterium]
MVAATLRGGRAQTGLRPFDPYRDFRSVADLMVVAFGDRLGPAGQMALAEMRRIARWVPLLWLYWPGGGGVMPASGFVWVEEGRVVGNASLRRASRWGGFFIGNVAVHPDWQGRGIARQLVEAALGEVPACGGRWVGLEVQAGNRVARRLYEHLGFQEVGRTEHLLRPAGLPRPGNLSLHLPLRRGRHRDGARLVELVHAMIPAPQRPLLELRERDYRPSWERTLDHWLDGRREFWWVAEEGGVICGAVRALRERGRRPDRLEVLIAPEHSGRFEAGLVRQGVASLGGGSRKMIEAVLASPTVPLVKALEEAGFQRERELVQMRR